MSEYPDNPQEQLGLAIDRLGNLATALDIPMPAEAHLKALREALPEIVQELKDLYPAVTGEPSPWDD